MDIQFIHKVYRTIGFTWALAMLWCFAAWKPWIALSITLGVALGAGVLYTYEMVTSRALVPGTEKPGRMLFKFILLHYVLVCVMLFGLVRWHGISLPAFCGGIVLTHFAILAKLAGIKIVERQQREKLLAQISNSVIGNKEP